MHGDRVVDAIFDWVRLVGPDGDIPTVTKRPEHQRGELPVVPMGDADVPGSRPAFGIGVKL